MPDSSARAWVDLGDTGRPDRVARPWNDPASWREPSAAATKDVRVVKLMPEYCVELPLWYHDWRGLGLGVELLNALADWQAEFDTNFDSETEWNSAEARHRWSARAEELVVVLRQALPAHTDLEVDLWPLGVATRIVSGTGRQPTM